MATASTTPAAELPPQLRQWQAQFEQSRRDARELVRGLSDAQMLWRPAPSRWSIAECFAHLNVAGRLYQDVLRERFSRARARGWLGEPPFAYGWLGGLLIWSTRPTNRRRVKTTAALLPPARLPAPAELIAEFMRLGDGWVARVYEARGLDLARIRLASPFIRLVRYNAAAALELNAVHEQRHLLQAREVMAAPGFPSG